MLHDFRPILFAAGASSAVVLTAIDWIHLIRSERALLEATLLFATGHYRDVKFASPDYHRARAISLINMRIDQGPVALTDGVIGAVFTLAHCEVRVVISISHIVLLNSISDSQAIWPPRIFT